MAGADGLVGGPVAAGGPVAVPAARGAAGYRQERVRGLRAGGLAVAAGWPLLAVLAVQVVLSLRLVWADTAFQDEAMYLWAGHLQWAHWLHGAPVPPFAAYFSGSPVVYPPVGALADSVGGLAGARVLSLGFMVGATVLLWGTAGRLFGRRAAFFAAALFAVLGPTLHLGAFATFDAMSLFLLAVAGWCVVRAGERHDATGWMLGAGVALAVANAAAYSSALFDPVVVVLALLVALPKSRLEDPGSLRSSARLRHGVERGSRDAGPYVPAAPPARREPDRGFRAGSKAGGRLAAGRVATLLTALATLLLVGMLTGGGDYVTGVGQTTLTRVGGADSALRVLADAWSWTGLVVVAAVCGVVVCWVRDRDGIRVWLLAVLAGAALLAPVEQARLHTTASLNKHVDLGAWFAAIAAGYALDKLITAAPAGRMRALTCGACVVALVFPVSLGAGQSREFATSWPNAASFIAILRPLAGHGSGRLLIEDPAPARYYLPAGTQWQRWSSTRNIVLPSGANTGGPAKAQGVVGAGDPAAFARFIAKGYFSLVALNFADTTALDHRIAADLRRNHNYHITQVIPYGTEVPPLGQGTYVIWQYEPRR